MNKKSKIFWIISIILLGWIILYLNQHYKYPKTSEINKRVHYLERVINEPLGPGSEIMELGNEFYEWILFSYSFSSFAFTNIAIQDTSYKTQAIQNIKTSIERVFDYQITSPYGVEASLINSDSIHNYYILYLGHLNLMLGCYRLLTNDSTYNDINDNISKSLFNRYNDSKIVNLESYASSIWIPDNAVAMASLKLHSTNTGSNYDSVCFKWSEYVKSNYIDKETGVLITKIDPNTGIAIEEPRGSMLGWSIMFIYQFDSEFAIDLYQNYKKHFSKDYIIFRLFRERHNSKETNMGDIDSGPIFQGYSIPANEFALCNSILAGDYKTAKKLERLVNFGTKKVNKNDEIKYEVRFIDMNISPMAEALILYSLTITKWTDD